MLGDVGEYEYMLARKMAEERAKLPPSPEVLPDLPLADARILASQGWRLRRSLQARVSVRQVERRAEYSDVAAGRPRRLDAATDAEAVEDRGQVAPHHLLDLLPAQVKERKSGCDSPWYSLRHVTLSQKRADEFQAVDLTEVIEEVTG